MCKGRHTVTNSGHHGPGPASMHGQVSKCWARAAHQYLQMLRQGMGIWLLPDSKRHDAKLPLEVGTSTQHRIMPMSYVWNNYITYEALLAYNTFIHIIICMVSQLDLDQYNISNTTTYT